jgi:hypothetical protein
MADVTPRDEKTRDWALRVAREMLRHRPDVLREFERELTRSVAGTAMVLSLVEAIPDEHWFGERRDSFQSISYIDGVMRTAIVNWLRQNAHRWDEQPSHQKNANPDGLIDEARAAPTEPEWKQRATDMAREIIKRRKQRDLYPSQEDIANEIANVLRAEGVVGEKGKPVTGAYIKRHVLGPQKISSAVARQLSSKPRQGK